eukprot:403343130
MDVVDDFSAFIMGGFTTDSEVYSSATYTKSYPIFMKQSYEGTILWQSTLSSSPYSKVSLIKSSLDSSQYAAAIDSNDKLSVVIGDGNSGVAYNSLYVPITQPGNVIVPDLVFYANYLILIMTYKQENKQILFMLTNNSGFTINVSIVQDYSSVKFMSMFVDNVNNVLLIGGSSMMSTGLKYAAMRVFGCLGGLTSEDEQAFDNDGEIQHKFYAKHIYAEQSFENYQVYNTGFSCTALYSDYQDQSVDYRHLYKFSYDATGFTSDDYEKSYEFSITDIGQCQGLRMGSSKSIVNMLTYNPQTLKVSLVIVDFDGLASRTTGTYIYASQTSFGNSIKLESSIIISSSEAYFVGSLNQLNYLSQTKTFTKSFEDQSYIMSMDNEQTCIDVNHSTDTQYFYFQTLNFLTLSESSHQYYCTGTASNQGSTRRQLDAPSCTLFQTQIIIDASSVPVSLDNYKKWCTYIQPSSLSTQVYIIGSSMKIPITSFQKTCPSMTLNYRASLVIDNDFDSYYTLPLGVSFKSNAQYGQYFNIFSLDTSLAGTYTIKVEGYDNFLDQKDYFTFILDMRVDYKIPFFESEIKDQTVQVNKPLFYKLPDSVNENGNANKITVDLGSFHQFVYYQASQTSIYFNPSQNSQAGEYSITITITDSKVQTVKNYYILKVKVVKDSSIKDFQNSTNFNQTQNQSQNYIPPIEQYPINETIIEKLSYSQDELVQYFDYIENLSESEYVSGIFPESLIADSGLSYNSPKYKRLINKYVYDTLISPKISKIDYNGLVTINFGSQIVIPKCYKNFTDSVILVTINGAQSYSSKTSYNINNFISNDDALNTFTWHVSEFTQNNMKIQIKFDNPSKISQDV